MIEIFLLPICRYGPNWTNIVCQLALSVATSFCQVSVPWRLPPGLGPVAFTVPPTSTDAVSPSYIFHSIPFNCD